MSFGSFFFTSQLPNLLYQVNILIQAGDIYDILEK